MLNGCGHLIGVSVPILFYYYYFETLIAGCLIEGGCLMKVQLYLYRFTLWYSLSTKVFCCCNLHLYVCMLMQRCNVMPQPIQLVLLFKFAPIAIFLVC